MTLANGKEATMKGGWRKSDLCEVRRKKGRGEGGGEEDVNWHLF